MMAKMYQRFLEGEGFEFAAAFNGEEGLATLKKDKPDIILLDIMMPKMSGLATLKVIKDDPDLKDIPVVILTNLGDWSEDIENCKRLGAEDYWVKANMSLKEVGERIRKILTK
jgi:CheY-like chemotaxis protein